MKNLCWIIFISNVKCQWVLRALSHSTVQITAISTVAFILVCILRIHNRISNIDRCDMDLH